MSILEQYEGRDEERKVERPTEQERMALITDVNYINTRNVGQCQT